MRRHPILIVLGTVLCFTACQKENGSTLTQAQNAIPVVNAGPNFNITLPMDSVTLTGSATDADGTITAYFWNQVSGPSPALFFNSGNAMTKVKNLTQGTYIFQLKAVDDDGATGQDTTLVVVNPSPIQTLTLQPSNNPTERELGISNGTDVSNTGSPDIPIEAWTSGGGPYTIRDAIKFDLSSIPASATIISASLYLYSYPPPTLNGNFTDANFGTGNAMLVQRITANWTPASTNWTSQPVTTTTDQVIAPHTTLSQLDLSLDVTNMTRTMISGGINYGYFLKLQNEVTYNSRIFVASYNTSYASKHPKLVVVYQ